jgi:hypothetical protein
MIHMEKLRNCLGCVPFFGRDCPAHVYIYRQTGGSALCRIKQRRIVVAWSTCGYSSTFAKKKRHAGIRAELGRSTSVLRGVLHDVEEQAEIKRSATGIWQGSASRSWKREGLGDRTVGQFERESCAARVAQPGAGLEVSAVARRVDVVAATRRSCLSATATTAHPREPRIL